MARTEGQWEKRIGGYIQTVKNTTGILLKGAGRYISFGTIFGSTGYGIRDNGGTLEYKDSGGSWQAFSGGSSIGDSFETVSKNLRVYPYTLNYGGNGSLDNIVYNIGGGNSITKTLNYDGSGTLTSIVLSGSTPGGIDLTKTLTYTSGKLSDITYS